MKTRLDIEFLCEHWLQSDVIGSTSESEKFGDDLIDQIQCEKAVTLYTLLTNLIHMIVIR